MGSDLDALCLAGSHGSLWMSPIGRLRTWSISMSFFRAGLLALAVLLGHRLFLVFRRAIHQERVTWGRFETCAALATLNLVAFFFVALVAGGDAWNGKVVGEQYYLGDHGHYTPVSFGFWVYSLLHALVTIPFFLAMFIAQFVRWVSPRGRDKDDLQTRGRGTV